MTSSIGALVFGTARPKKDRLLSLTLVLWSLAALMGDEGSVLLLNLMTCVSGVMAIGFMVRHARLQNLIMTVFFLVLFAFSLFAAFVLNVIDEVVPEVQFSFSVFSFSNVQTALAVNSMALALAVLVFSFMPKIYRKSTMFQTANYTFVESALASRGSETSWGVWILPNWILILGVFLLTPNVHQFPYPENQLQPGNIHATIRVFLVLIPFASFLLTLIRSQYRTTTISVVMRLTFYAAIYLIALTAGSRGAVTGLLFSALAIDVALNRDRTGMKSLWIVIDCLYILFAIFNWPHMRVLISDVGWWPAFVASFQGYMEVLRFRSLEVGGIVLGDFPMLGQSLFHFLYVIALVENGDAYGFQTFINLFPQQLPEVLDGTLWDRPVNDNWIVGEYYLHGGGFYALANAYWNQGWMVAMAFIAVLAWLLGQIEGYFKDKTPEFLIAYFAFLYLIPVNMYYGIQGLVRCLEYGLIALLVVRAFVNRAVRESPSSQASVR